MILDGPTYAGITELGASCITLGIWSKCNELNIVKVTRYMNREILQIFYRNNITVPFPHMTISGMTGTPAVSESSIPQEEKEDTPEEEEPVKE